MIKPVLIKSLSFAYETDRILDHVDLSVEKGEFVSIIGPNGSGKTTLLKHITRLLPSKETIWVDEKPLQTYLQKDLAKIMALVPQANHFEYGFSAFDVVMMGRHPHIEGFYGEGHKDVRIVEEAMQLTDTAKFKARNINSLSGGERQRVIVARAIAQDASIMLLDEPITYLDIHHQIDIVRLIKNHSKTQGKTVIAVLHDLNFALKFSDKVVLLHEGAVISVGSPHQVLTKENLKKAYGIDVDLIYHEGQLTHIMPIF